jgi:glycosyltransferase involved in cell wall biosynthesis
MRFLLINQTFHPDVMATGQYLAEVARGLFERGHEVTVITGRRAYDDPAKKFSKRENWHGVNIHRVAATGLGKGAKWRRAVDFASFIVSCCLKLLTLPRPDVVVTLTTPPLISFIGAVYSRLRGARLVYWVMDLNPDEAIAAGWLREGSALARILQWMSCYSFRHSQRIIALDRFMQCRIEAKGINPDRIVVHAPWPLDRAVQFDEAGREQFRRTHGVEEKFVVMYSGNHSPCHPLDTLMAAARALRAESRFIFLFVGGGSEFRRVQEFARSHSLCNILCLPYRPLGELSASLSAADLHVVVMGDPFVGIVHPCKLYNILSIHSPLLYLGPQPSHVSDLLTNATLDLSPHYSCRHGDETAVMSAIRSAATLIGPRRTSPGSGTETNPALTQFLATLESAATHQGT